MIRLEKRPPPSRDWSLATPVLAVLATMIAGGLLFARWARTRSRRSARFSGIRCSASSRSTPARSLLVKAGPLILIAIGLSLGFRAGIWNIGAEGQYIIGAICGAGVGLAFYPRRPGTSFR